jgi:hypothetical protein
MEELMKKALAVSISLCALLVGLSPGAAAGPANGVLMNIPFSFYAGDQLMPSGKYIFDMPRFGNSAVGSLVRVTSPDGTYCTNVFSLVVNALKADNEYHVTFTRYGEQYFLSKVRNSTLGASLLTSRSEKAVAGEYRKSSGTVATIELVNTNSKAK